MSLVKHGWKVPCRINLDTTMWTGEIDGQTRHAVLDPFDCPLIIRIHEWGEKISDRQYDWLVGIKGWAAQHDTSHPCLNPWTSIDVTNLRPLIPRSKGWTPE